LDVGLPARRERHHDAQRLAGKREGVRLERTQNQKENDQSHGNLLGG
jgi:hypothetical protein